MKRVIEVDEQEYAPGERLVKCRCGGQAGDIGEFADDKWCSGT